MLFRSHLNIMITAGPTREPLDPVRYITNHSSGKMGFAIAASAASRGANVTLVSGPVALPTPPFVQRIDVTTALEMEAAVQQSAQQQQIFIGCAAVADYRAVAIAEEKIKKLEEQEYNSSEDGLISSNQSSEISNDSGEKWLKSIFRCKGSVKYCMPSEEEVCSERFLRFYEDSWEINGPSNLTDEEYKSAVKKYKEKWSPIYQLYDSEVYLFGGGNGGTTTLKEIRVKRISIMKYDLTIEFIDGSKTNDEITLIPHNNSYKIDYVKQTKDFY